MCYALRVFSFSIQVLMFSFVLISSLEVMFIVCISCFEVISFLYRVRSNDLEHRDKIRNMFQ
jgi:hypothetical protein